MWFVISQKNTGGQVSYWCMKCKDQAEANGLAFAEQLKEPKNEVYTAEVRGHVVNTIEPVK